MSSDLFPNMLRVQAANEDRSVGDLMAEREGFFINIEMITDIIISKICPFAVGDEVESVFGVNYRGKIIKIHAINSDIKDSVDYRIVLEDGDVIDKFAVYKFRKVD